MQAKKFKEFLIIAACAFSLGDFAAKAAAPATPQGFITYRTYNGDQRAAIRAGTGVPDGIFYPKRLEGPYVGIPGPDTGEDDVNPPGNVRQNYNMELIGYFYPPKDGKIMLAITTDDPGELYLSTDDDPANKKLIATESQWNPIRSFFGAFDTTVDPPTALRRNIVTTGDPPVPRPENWSSFITVTKGKPYFIQAIGTEFGGGDNTAVAFRYEGDPDFADGDKPILGQYLSPISSPPAKSTIVLEPQDAAAYVGSTASFSVGLDVPPTATVTSIKWTKNGADVPDSDTNSLTVAVALADNSAKFKAIVTASDGTLTSREATLTACDIANDFALGVVKFEAWIGITGTAVDGLLSDPHFQDPPDDKRLLGGIDSPNGYADNYGARITGFVIPPTDGAYNFFIRSDDASQLLLSPDSDPAKAVLICEETACCNAFVEPGDPKTSDPQTLKAGTKYAFIAYVKEGGGGDYLQVAWRKEGDTTPAGSLKPLSGSVIGANAKPTCGDVQITQQPVLPPKMEEGQSWSVSVDGIVTPVSLNYPVLVKWQKNGADIPGANSKTYTIKTVTPADAGTYRAVLSAPSGNSANSTELTAVVIADKVPPTLALAQKSFSSDTKVVVTFSESVSAASANTAANYKIDNGITVSAAAITSNPRTIELTTTAIAKGSTNHLTVSGVEDLFKNVIAANSSIEIGFQKGIYLVTADPNEDGGPLTFAGDIAVNQHLLDRGFDVQVAQGARVPDDGSTALGRDLIIQSSSLASGTVEVTGDTIPVGKFKNLAIPAIEWEASSIDAFGFAELNSVLGTIASQTQINIVDASHPLAAGLPKGLVTVTTPETYSVSIPVGGHIIATPATDPTYSLIYYYEKGEKGFNDFVMPARRVFFFFQDNTAASANDNGWKLFDAAVDWSLGVEAPPTPVGQPVLSVSHTGTSLTISWTNGGKLQSTASLNSPIAWADESSTSPVTAPISGTAKFYRVIK